MAAPMEMGESARAMAERHAQLVGDFEQKRREKAIVVSTNDGTVRNQLRQLGEPITLFGEREPERRERLRKLLAKLDHEQGGVAMVVDDEPEPVEEVTKELFYTEGPPELKAWRTGIVRYSLGRAAKRVGLQRAQFDDLEGYEAAQVRDAEKGKAVMQQSSELGDDRPISGCRFAGDGSYLATCSWSGAFKLWSLPECRKALTVRAHDERCTGIATHPESGAGRSSEVVSVVTASADSTAKLWGAEGKLLHALEGHTDRLARVEFYPDGSKVGTCSFDKTWRLWDVETGAHILEQEGHSRAVYGIAFQCDGALAVTGGLDGVGRVWDLRSGRSVCVLEGHVKGILACDFSPNGHTLATGSQDHTCKLWDLRKKGTTSCPVMYTIAAHLSLVSQVRFEPSGGHALMTAGYDKLLKLWSTRDFSLVASLASHEGKIMGADMLPGLECLASVSYDRTIKLWK